MSRNFFHDFRLKIGVKRNSKIIAQNHESEELTKSILQPYGPTADSVGANFRKSRSELPKV